MTALLQFLKGYLVIHVSGFSPERFMNLIISNQIVVWDVASTENGYQFYTGRKNLLRMKPYLQKANMKMHTATLQMHRTQNIIKKYIYRTLKNCKMTVNSTKPQ